MPISPEAQQLKHIISGVIIDNNSEDITPALLRQVLAQIIDFADGGLIIPPGALFSFLGIIPLTYTPNTPVGDAALAIATAAGVYTDVLDINNAPLVINPTTYFAFFYKAPAVNHWVSYPIEKLPGNGPTPNLPKGATLSGLQDGANTVFNTPDDFELATLQVFRNGKLEIPILDYEADFSGFGVYNQVVFVNPPVPTDNLYSYYIPKI